MCIFISCSSRICPLISASNFWIIFSYSRGGSLFFLPLSPVYIICSKASFMLYWIRLVLSIDSLLMLVSWLYPNMLLSVSSPLLAPSFFSKSSIFRFMIISMLLLMYSRIWKQSTEFISLVFSSLRLLSLILSSSSVERILIAKYKSIMASLIFLTSVDS